MAAKKKSTAKTPRFATAGAPVDAVASEGESRSTVVASEL